MDFLKILLTSFASLVVIFLLTKIMGHKQVGQLDFFDYVVGITIGSIAAEMATELEKPWKPLLAMLVYGLVAVALSLITNKFPRARKYINGSPTVLLHEGKLFRDNLKKSKLDLGEFLMMCREEGYFHLSDIQTATLEANGKLTVLPRSLSRPLTPADMDLNPQPDCPDTEVILDGRIQEKNLKRVGLDAKWLEKQLKSQGFHSAGEVFLGICDREKKLSLYPSE